MQLLHCLFIFIIVFIVGWTIEKIFKLISKKSEKLKTVMKAISSILFSLVCGIMLFLYGMEDFIVWGCALGILLGCICYLLSADSKK